MSNGDGSLALAAVRAGERTILERVRYDGISRCSRAFYRGTSTLVVLSQLGPGVVRGDRVTTSGRLGSAAHLIVTGQSATRLMGGSIPARSRVDWHVETGAVLELIAQPLIAAGGAQYTSDVRIDVAAGACVLFSELACVAAGARVRLRTSVHGETRELYYDALDAAAAAPQTVGTLTIIGPSDEFIAPLVAAFDRVADTIGARVGVGALACGAYVRVIADDVWATRLALETLRAAAWSVLDAAGQRRTGDDEKRCLHGQFN